MRQGLFAVIFLLNIVMWIPTMVFANEITQDEVRSWLSNPKTQSSVETTYQLALQDQIKDLQSSLERMPFPQQEVVRYLLLKKIEDERLVLSPRMAIFIQSQQTQSPRYYVTESGDGYSVVLPAFNASLVADRLIKDWKKDQTTIDFIIAAESQQLLLISWLQGDEYQIQQKEALFLREADSLSLQALQSLSDQLVGNSLVKWLPSTDIVIKLAQLTQDERLYSLLWKMKGDKSSVEEVYRLAQKGDEFSIQQLMNATQNPAIKSEALKQLVGIKPMPENVQSFLVSKLNHASEGFLVAQALSESEHHDWLVWVLNSGKINQSKALLSSILVSE